MAWKRDELSKFKKKDLKSARTGSAINSVDWNGTDKMSDAMCNHFLSETLEKSEKVARISDYFIEDKG